MGTHDEPQIDGVGPIPDTTKRPRYQVESVDNALQLILMFERVPEIRVKDASDVLGVAPSTAHRLLTTLEWRGLVAHDPVRRVYLPGTALLGVGLAVVKNMDVRQRARAVLERVAGELGETVHLLVLQGRDVLFLDCVESTKALRAGSRVGFTLPAECTAAGKVLLSTLPGHDLASLYGDGQMRQGTANAVRSLPELQAELGKVVERGYGINDGESEVGLTAVAVAVPRAQSMYPAAISVSGPSQRISAEAGGEIALVLRNALEAHVWAPDRSRR
jgi:IclR family acetate operon transcriptional repressor